LKYKEENSSIVAALPAALIFPTAVLKAFRPSGVSKTVEDFDQLIRYDVTSKTSLGGVSRFAKRATSIEKG